MLETTQISSRGRIFALHSPNYPGERRSTGREVCEILERTDLKKKSPGITQRS